MAMAPAWMMGDRFTGGSGGIMSIGILPASKA
jgi:hypothetical protein